MFADRLFKTPDQETQDGAVYTSIRDGVFDHYRPVGLLEEFWADRAAAEMLRSLRLVGHEQESFHTLKFIATAMPVETILKVQAANTRQLQFAVDQLEKLQELRKSLPSDEAREDFGDFQGVDSEDTGADAPNLPKSEACEAGNCETNPNVTEKSEPSESDWYQVPARQLVNVIHRPVIWFWAISTN